MSSKPSNENTTRLVDSGFAVLRTPLLPFAAFLDWSRRAAIAGTAENANVENAAHEGQLDIMRDIVSEPAFREAVRVASPDLSNEILAWTTGTRKIDEQRLLDSLVRYFSRASYRCTPFGLFAGCSLVNVGDHTALTVGPHSTYRRYSRIDMDVLAELTRTLGTDNEYRRRLPLRTNSSVALIGGRLHYVETRYADRARQYVLTAADPEPEILDALARGRTRTTFTALAEPLLADGYSPEEVDAFLTELLDSQLLIPDVDPVVSGGDAMENLAETLEAAGCAPTVSAALREARARLSSIDDGGVGREPDYGAAISPLRALNVEIVDKKSIQVDLYKPLTEASLGRGVVDDAAEAAELLSRIAPGHDHLALFVARFDARYETREVPLLEALDEEVGVGMPDVNADDRTMRRVAELNARREATLAELRCRAAYAHAAEVELTDEDVEKLRSPDSRSAPDALAFFGSIAAKNNEAVDRGDYQLVINHVSGPSGARLLGRFSHLDPELERRVQDHLAAEEALQPDVIFAEIIHLPQGRLGNVIARPKLRAYELPYIGRSAAPAELQIDPADLWVSVDRGRIRLRSARLGREVRPRLSSAHNYLGGHELPVYRFLCCLQNHVSQGFLQWHWGVQGTAPFLPRVTRGRLILSRATWNLSVRDIEPLVDAARKSNHEAIDRWRTQRALPSIALFVDGDNRLPIDFTNPVSTRIFGNLLKGKRSATVVEPILGADKLCVTGPDGGFTNEIVIPFVRRVASPVGRTDRPRSVEARSGRMTKRTYPPGSEWLYAKLYCGRGGADHILRDLVAPLLQRARAELPIQSWFFVRFSDPEFHIRLRFKLAPTAVPRLVELLGAIAAPAIASGRLARLIYDTYLPEVERYGGPEAMATAGEIFTVDSDAALALVTTRQESLRRVPRDLVTLAGIDRLLTESGISQDGLMRLLDAAIGQVTPAVRQARSMEFRQCRSDVMRMVAAAPKDEESRAVHAILSPRSAGIRPLLQSLRAMESAGTLETPFDNVLLSLSHMWVNRTTADSSAHESVLYDRLHRTYRSVSGRARADAALRAADVAVHQ